MSRRDRSRYNPLLADEEDDLESLPNAAGGGVMNVANTSNSRPSENMTLNRGFSSSNNPSRSEHLANSKTQDEVVNVTTSLVGSSIETNPMTAGGGAGGEGYSTTDVGSPMIQNKITVIVLDTAQKRFPIDADPEWKVHTFKSVGNKIHKVAPLSQRLIFRGRMLDDSKSLREMGIFQDDVIIHLFPKPRVKIVSEKDSESNDTSDNTTDQGSNGGAHVPQIVLNEEEQERRGQILVLGSYEIAEAQNNVRLLCLLLGTISFMRLLTLLSIAMGAAEVPMYDDFAPQEPDGIWNNTDGGYSGGSYPDEMQFEPRLWEKQDYFDLVVSFVGFVVARIGMRATHENTSRIAFVYLIGTIIAGILWNIWNIFEFIVFVIEEKAKAAKSLDGSNDFTNQDIRSVGFFTVMLPIGVWFMCCARAWQFRQLIVEAELEAAERIRSELNLVEGDRSMGQSDDLVNESNARELDVLTSSRRSIV